MQKVLARAGFGSRREIEAWIEAGRVSVNGRKAALGDAVGRGDAVRVDGRLVPAHRLFERKLRVIGYHKPGGLVCTRRDEQGRPTVYQDLPALRSGRWLGIGRLDLNTTGLLLFTTEGELAHRLMHPSSGVEREYAVRVLGTVTVEMQARLQEGVMLEDGVAKFESLVDAGGTGANHWYHVVLREGRNREVRRLWESQGVTVSRLIRVRYGPIGLPREHRPGRWWELEPGEVDQLLALAGMPAKREPSSGKPPRPAARMERQRNAGKRTPAAPSPGHSSAARAERQRNAGNRTTAARSPDRGPVKRPTRRRPRP